MNATFRLDREQGLLFDSGGRRFDPCQRVWIEAHAPVSGELVDSIVAASWLQRQSGMPGLRERNPTARHSGTVH